MKYILIILLLIPACKMPGIKRTYSINIEDKDGNKGEFSMQFEQSK